MNEQHIDTLLNAMTLEEQVSLLAGASFWMTVPVERLGIPAIKVSDGPNGARGGGSLVGGVKAASFPVAISLASTWNTALVAQVGQALGQEAHSKGARVLLAPTVNLHRSTQNGRNFECYSEDPFLSAQVCVAYIQGVQGEGVGATVKHYVGNESEFERMSISSEIDERALRELYLVPFEAAVKEARTWAVMCAYNKLNGTFASENRRLLTDILKREWGFDGVVMSDWFATHTTVESVNAGLDLEMPGPTKHRGQKLLEAVRAGEVHAETLQDSARRVLRLLTRVGAFERPAPAEEQAIDRPEHRALIRRAGVEGTVLLKNDGVLPLDPKQLKKLALIGPNVQTAQIMGGGSAQVNAHYRVSPYEGIQAQLGEGVELAYEAGCSNHKLLPLLQGQLSAEYFSNRDLSGEAVSGPSVAQAEVMWSTEPAPGVNADSFSARLSTRFTPVEDGEHHFGLVSAGLSRLFVNGQLVVDNWGAWKQGETYFGAGSQEATGTLRLQVGHAYDVTIEYATPAEGVMGLRAVRAGVTLPLGTEHLERAAQLAASCDVALVFVGHNGEWDSEGQDRSHMELVGRQNELIERVASANPNTVVVLQTGSPVSLPWLDKVAGVLQAWYPGQEAGNAIADVLFGAADPSGRLPQTFPVRLEDNAAHAHYPGGNGKVRYGEGLFVGYRHHDTKNIAPLFPFGFGLSYTTFAYGGLRMSAESLQPGDTLTVTLDVTNTGQRAGQEVVQLYVRDERASLPRPEKELKGFCKVDLRPGETKTVTLTLGMRALAYFDDARAAWVAEAGRFEVLVGSSSRDLRARAAFTLQRDWVQPLERSQAAF
ncbi:beta-glucosidase [Archangium lansingense]|uniref:Glycoside hydrolase family 3 C-terminal domain-containing protein n=1 Tax=Archangium lansingense TaxID=2995310 RepID=A0ABT4A2H5_9BACT|nr:glycoside hydrolase family 3 C-terminal domain-containing protein [Archangium lansinium]MCY1075204.1 glycoside hydrolase family 3 C-terminal domain-containing protein [Archangium lansinium]